MPDEENRVLRNYEVRELTNIWLTKKAKREGRSVIKQAGVELERAMARDETND